MKGPLRFPIRLKILVALLFVVTGVVSVIVLTMANLFHLDKKAYITDLASMMAVSTAEESRSLLVGYQERLQVYARIIGNEDLSREVKARVLREFFDDFPELVALSQLDARGEIAAAYNGDMLKEAGLSKDDLRAFRSKHPLPIDSILSGEVYVGNSTISETLPTLTLALARPVPDGNPTEVAAAVVRLDSLLRLADRSKGFEVYLADGDGTYLAHSSVSNVALRRPVRDRQQIEQDLGQLSAGLAMEYVEDGIEMIGGFASARFAGVSAGARVPKSAAYLASGQLLYRLLLVALALLFGATIVGLFWAHRLTRPVAKLSAATREIAKGDFGVHVEVESRDEIGALADSFNQMASELHDREQALEETQRQLIQSEKLAAFGQLGAGIAHEVKNPLAGILGCAQLSLRKAEPGTPVEKNLRLIEKETKRCKSIIENLLKFARQEKAVLQPTEINPVIHDAVAIVAHQMEMNKVHLETDLAEDLPTVHGNANQLQQVLMNLIMNAQQAMQGEPGTVQVTSRLTDAGKVEIVVADTGPGIPPEVQSKLFEPFFTTKRGGKGTGLGLSVSFGIIRDHSGEITIDSTVGEGATFRIKLPTMADRQAEPFVSAKGA